VQYNFGTTGAGTGVTGPYGYFYGPAGVNPGFGYSGYTGVTGQTGFALQRLILLSGPRGPVGPPVGNYTGSAGLVSNVFYPPIYDPGIPGALYWLPAYGNTGIFISNGIPAQSKNPS
jgi:hypothetical protein